MNKSNRREFSAEFKTKVVIEALARKYELRPFQISQWKAAFLENASSAFEKKNHQQHT